MAVGVCIKKYNAVRSFASHFGENMHVISNPPPHHAHLPVHVKLIVSFRFKQVFVFSQVVENFTSFFFYCHTAGIGELQIMLLCRRNIFIVWFEKKITFPSSTKGSTAAAPILLLLLLYFFLGYIWLLPCQNIFKFAANGDKACWSDDDGVSSVWIFFSEPTLVVYVNRKMASWGP